MILLASLLIGCGSTGSDEASPPDRPPVEITPAPAPADPDALPVTDEGITADACDEVEAGIAPAGPGCLSGTLSCGDTVVGHTLGGVNHFTTQFYEKHHCTPGLTNHDGGDERVYALTLPEGDHVAEVYLDTPCADLDLAAIKWSGDDCPSVDANVMQCEMWPKKRNKREKVKIVSRGETRWLIVVEGKDEAEGAFSVHVACREGLN